VYYQDLTDLINRDAAAYTYYYSLAPKTQEMLQRRELRSLDEMRRAVEEFRLAQRPEAF
jgi:hypothetical protein